MSDPDPTPDEIMWTLYGITEQDRENYLKPLDEVKLLRAVVLAMCRQRDTVAAQTQDQGTPCVCYTAEVATILTADSGWAFKSWLVD
jgi:hypothetical protein